VTNTSVRLSGVTLNVEIGKGMRVTWRVRRFMPPNPSLFHVADADRGDAWAAPAPSSPLWSAELRFRPFFRIVGIAIEFLEPTE
jgi:hypothetical protein